MAQQSHTCAALIIAAPASGQGKTSVTAALSSHYRMKGKQVRVFKVGPDFLDPMILARASGHPVYQLDLWMVGKQHSRLTASYMHFYFPSNPQLIAELLLP